MASIRDYDQILCIICMSKIQNPLMSRICGHSYCDTCILYQLAEKEVESCPICSKALSERDLVENIHLKDYLKLRQFHVSLRQCSKCHSEGICSFHKLLRNENSFEDDELAKLDCFEKTLNGDTDKLPSFSMIKDELESDKRTCQIDLETVRRAARECNLKLSEEMMEDDEIEESNPMIDRHIEDIEKILLSYGRELPSYFQDLGPKICQISTFSFPNLEEANGNSDVGEVELLKQLDSPPPILKSIPDEEYKSKPEAALKDYVKLCLGHKYMSSKNKLSDSPSIKELEDAYEEKQAEEASLSANKNVRKSDFQKGIERIICAAIRYSSLEQLYKFHGTVNTNTITPSIQTISFNRTGELFIAGGTMRFVRVYEFENMIKSPQNLAPYVNNFDCQHRVFSSCFNPVEDAIFITGNSNGELTWFDSVHCLQKSMDSLVSSSHSQNHAVFSLDWSSCFKNVLASAAADSILKIWDINISKPIVKSIKIKDPINCVHFNPVDYTLLVATDAYSIFTLDFRMLKKESRNFKIYARKIPYAKWIDRSHFCTSSNDGTVRLWHKDHNTPLMKYEDHKLTENFTGFDVKDDLIAVGSEDAKVYIYDKLLSKSILSHEFQFSTTLMQLGGDDIISGSKLNSLIPRSMTWRPRVYHDGRNILAVGTSTGEIQILSPKRTYESEDS
ncbi:DgyrCDS7735 [Dimorphilus gyrociliatus]|uniref:DgyrCDS7735 n=1 Tax=Dimorphilus gyrociliatus TaxID=2664684 RepID=A0A7I8VS45_9ANNE|nr:DgyrCDS7735 [Dimorphilus gyrociliatus]